MLVYYFVPFIVSYRYLLFRDSNGHNSVTVQNRTHVYMNFFDHKDLEITSCSYALKSWNTLYIYIYIYIYTQLQNPVILGTRSIVCNFLNYKYDQRA